MEKENSLSDREFSETSLAIMQLEGAYSDKFVAKGSPNRSSFFIISSRKYITLKINLNITCGICNGWDLWE